MYQFNVGRWIQDFYEIKLMLEQFSKTGFVLFCRHSDKTLHASQDFHSKAESMLVLGYTVTRNGEKTCWSVKSHTYRKSTAGNEAALPSE